MLSRLKGDWSRGDDDGFPFFMKLRVASYALAIRSEGVLWIIEAYWVIRKDVAEWDVMRFSVWGDFLGDELGEH